MKPLAPKGTKTTKKGNVTINPKKEDLMSEKKLDPVGKANADIDNDGDVDKSDKYLHNRRKIRSKVIKMREAAALELRAKRFEEKEEETVDEGLKQARKNVGASTCWDGYTAKGTKKKNGKEVPNCVKEEEMAAAKQKSKDRLKMKMIAATQEHDRNKKMAKA